MPRFFLTKFIDMNGIASKSTYMTPECLEIEIQTEGIMTQSNGTGVFTHNPFEGSEESIF